MGGYGRTLLRERVLYCAVGAGCRSSRDGGLGVWSCIAETVEKEGAGWRNAIGAWCWGRGGGFHIGVFRILRLCSGLLGLCSGMLTLSSG